MGAFAPMLALAHAGPPLLTDDPSTPATGTGKSTWPGPASTARSGTETGADATSWITGVAFGHEVREGFEILGELHGECLVHGGAHERLLDIGARSRLSEHFTLLAGHGLCLIEFRNRGYGEIATPAP